MNKLEEKAKSLPITSGCYLMKNNRDQIIYVGKAKNLKNRVSSYFNQSEKNPKTLVLVGHIADFEFMLTGSDAEAFVLENNLIKKYSPKYNIRLKDDKTYPYVMVNRNEPFPRLEYVRKFKREKNVEVYGPFVTGSQVSDVMKILTKNFQLRDCSLNEFRKRKEPCLLFQMEQCSAPCTQQISTEDYEKNLETALAIFKGKGKRTIDFLDVLMQESAEELLFEKAAVIRDDLIVLKSFAHLAIQENAEMHAEKNIDVIAVYEGEREIDISLYIMRNGLLLGHKNFHFMQSDFMDSVDDSLVELIFQYYASSPDILPEKIMTPFSQELNLELEKVLDSELHRVAVLSPKKKYQKLWDITYNHAKETQRVRLLQEDSVFVGLQKLKELLSLKERPVVLECYDIAIFQGASPAAAQIVFHDGRPDRKAYRHYHLKERPEGNNDFAMMKELINRRIDNGALPDVFIVDGGKGQVRMFQEVLQEVGIMIPVIGIAKSKVVKKGNLFTHEEVEKSEERLIIPGRSNPYFLRQNRALYKIVVQMRDEAHRFSRRLHHKAELKKLIPGS